MQIGSAFASTVSQFIKMSEARLRVIVACGAAGGISATFNAPITGLFFGLEIVLREFSLDALFATILSSVSADLVSRAFFGSAPFFANMAHDLIVHQDSTYWLVALLGLAAGVVGFSFKTVLYKVEDLVSRLWRGRPEWARPAVGGIALGALLFALPGMYGVGYPVNKIVADHTVLWFLVVLMVGKIAAAAQAPLTAIASVAEMTGNFTLILPVMLTVGIATGMSTRLSHGSIYTEKLLRRGVDVDRPKPESVLQALAVSDAMLPLPLSDGRAWLIPARGEGTESLPGGGDGWAELVGPVADKRRPHALFANETLDQALRQLALYGRAGLPVLSPDGEHLSGWVTRQNVLSVMAEQVGASASQAAKGRLASELSVKDAPRG